VSALKKRISNFDNDYFKNAIIKNKKFLEVDNKLKIKNFSGLVSFIDLFKKMPLLNKNKDSSRSLFLIKPSVS
jgi:hypothetical protein